MCDFKASKLGVLVATDDTGVVTRVFREALSFIETSVEHLVYLSCTCIALVIFPARDLYL